MIDVLAERMDEASGKREYELAARYRDQLNALERAAGVQEMVSNQREQFDLIAVHDDDLEAAVAVMHVRNGRVVGRIVTVIDKVEELNTAELIARMIAELYGSGSPPPTVLVQDMPPDDKLWERWLASRRNSKVAIRVPARGAKARLMETAQANAREEFARHRLRRQSDHNARAKALRSLQEHLDLPEAPLRIECYDISTVQGTNTVASMVVMEDGLPRTSDYRHFKIKWVEGQDDFASMEEVLRRRFTRYLEEQQLPIEERGRFAYPPSLVLVDGGQGQVSAAVRALGELGIDVPIAGLAKRMEEVYLPGRAEPVRIPRGEEALYLLQRIRDEAHRFAVTYHRKLRGKSMVDSILDEVPGVGPTRKRALVRRFKSVKKMREAPLEDLAEVVPQNVAESLYAALH
jgi:excinuclease ABC subunit C